jgi:hypothetical protein
MNDGRGGSGDAIQVQKAFEYTLDQIGFDISAGVIWQDYINFLKVLTSPLPRAMTHAQPLSHSGTKFYIRGCVWF